jgi:hypothetical protein
MSNQDLAQAVNYFMLHNSPTLTEASPMAYDLLKSLARQLLFKVKTTSEHAEYVMGKKYSHIYANAVIAAIILEAADDEYSERVGASKRKRDMKRSVVSHPVMLTA